MRWIPLKLLIILVLVTSSSLVTAQSSTLSGIWQASNADYPHLQITQSPAGFDITARGGFLRHEIKASRLQQMASAGESKFHVVFPLGSEEIMLKITMAGKNLHARWSRPEVSSKTLFTTYSRKQESRSLTPMTGNISGKAFGKAKTTASIFQVSLYGPDNSRRFISTQSLGRSGGFNFNALADGVYWLYIEARGSTIIEAFPSMQRLVIENGESKILNVELE